MKSLYLAAALTLIATAAVADSQNGCDSGAYALIPVEGGNRAGDVRYLVANPCQRSVKRDVFLTAAEAGQKPIGEEPDQSGLNK